MLEAGRKILANKCHTALVLDEAQQLVGVVTIADIKRNVESLEQAEQLAIRRALRDICTIEILCVYPEEPLIVAWERIGSRGLYLLPVVDKNNPRQVMGVISKEQIELAGDLISTRIALAPYLMSN